MKERSQRKSPEIISELNANLELAQKTVESIAEEIGISKATLYRWVKNDSEFFEALIIIKEVQKDDPFKTGGVEDSQVNSIILAWLLLETKDRLYKKF